MKISDVFFIMFIHLEKVSMKERKFIQFYNKSNLQPCAAFDQTPVSRTPTEYDMLEMVYVTKGQYNQLKKFSKSNGILRDYGLSIPTGEK